MKENRTNRIGSDALPQQFLYVLAKIDFDEFSHQLFFVCVSSSAKPTTVYSFLFSLHFYGNHFEGVHFLKTYLLLRWNLFAAAHCPGKK